MCEVTQKLGCLGLHGSIEVEVEGSPTETRNRKKEKEKEIYIEWRMVSGGPLHGIQNSLPALGANYVIHHAILDFFELSMGFILIQDSEEIAMS